MKLRIDKIDFQINLKILFFNSYRESNQKLKKYFKIIKMKIIFIFSVIILFVSSSYIEVKDRENHIKSCSAVINSKFDAIHKIVGEIKTVNNLINLFLTIFLM